MKVLDYYLHFCHQQTVAGREGEPLSLAEILSGAPAVGHLDDDSSVADTVLLAVRVILDLVVGGDAAAPMTFDPDVLWTDLLVAGVAAALVTFDPDDLRTDHVAGAVPLGLGKAVVIVAEQWWMLTVV